MINTDDVKMLEGDEEGKRKRREEEEEKEKLGGGSERWELMQTM